MGKDFDLILDECIDQINEGMSLENCLARYPEHAQQLKPLLTTMLGIRDISSFLPRETSKSLTRQRLDTALMSEEKEFRKRQQRRNSLFSWALATAAAVLAFALIGFAVHQIITPTVISPITTQANFRLLLSDQENDISDFESLEVAITSIGMLRGGEESGWEVIELEESVVLDLTRLQGLNAQEIWGGIIPEGQYIQIFIYIEDVTGTLKNGETVDVIVPSGNLQISKPFVVNAGDSLVNFVYDITVVAAGNEYILLPQIDQSGAEQEFHELGEGDLTLRIIDTENPVTPGQNVTALVSLGGNPLPGAQVKVNEVHVGNTSVEAGQEGLVSFTVPYDEELEIKAEKGELEGELKIEFGDELTIRVVEGVVAPGQSIMVQVTLETLQGVTVSIPGAQVEVKDMGVFLADEDGRLSLTVPYEDELEIKAEKGELEGELEIDLEEEFEEGELTIQVVEGEVVPGQSITILVTFMGNPVDGALVKVDKVGIFLTDVHGRTIPFTIPHEDELEIKAEKGELEGELEIDLEEEVELEREDEEEEIELEEEEELEEFEGVIEVIDGDIWRVIDEGEIWIVNVSEAEIRGEAEVGLEVEIAGYIIEDNEVLALEAEIKEAEEEEEDIIDFEGIIEAIDGDIWIITVEDESWTVDVSEAEIIREPEVGLRAFVVGIEENDVVIALEVEIEAVEDEEDIIDFEGIIEAIDGDIWIITVEDESWMVDVSEAEIRVEPEVELRVVVAGIIEDDTIIALEIDEA